MKIFTFWRSLASFRVRIGLNLKGLVAEQCFINLPAGEQRAPDYTAINPQGLLPALIDGEGTAPLVQSLAILEYLDETHPEPPFLPKDSRGRARVRALAHMAAGDAHSLFVPRVRNYLSAHFKADEEAQNDWARHWTNEGLRAIEVHLAGGKETGRYCHGESPTIADISVVSLAVGHHFFKGTLDAYPTLARIYAQCMTLEAFASAHPLKQPGAPQSL
jgi:maleylacetoacetate isomerase